MPTWFFAFVAICLCIAVFNTYRRLKSGKPFTVSPVTMVAALVIIVVAFGIMLAIQLGFIPDHAP
jgi:hypothetical protein